jgi:hypothetical protein
LDIYIWVAMSGLAAIDATWGLDKNFAQIVRKGRIESLPAFGARAVGGLAKANVDHMRRITHRICGTPHNDAEPGSLGATCLGKIGRPSEIFSTGNPAAFPCLQGVSAREQRYSSLYSS